jgi:hypothetical protein
VTRKHLLDLVSDVRAKSELPKPSETMPTTSSDSMDVDESVPKESVEVSKAVDAVKEKEKEVVDILPESDVYLRLLVVLGLIDAGQTEKVSDDRGGRRVVMC